MTRRSTVVCCLFALVVAEALSGIVGSLITGMTFDAARDSFLIPNVVIGLACGACGTLIAWHRPGNVLGWLLLGAGVSQTATAGVAPWLAQALERGAGGDSARTLATMYALGWPWSVSLFIPLTLLLFPDGHLPARGWRWVAWLAAANAVVQVLSFGSDSGSTGLHDKAGAEARSWLALPKSTSDVLGWSNALLGAIYLSALVGLVLRYRRGDETRRRQLLWLMWATAVSTLVIVVSRATSTDELALPVLVLTLVALIPASMAIAVLRYQLLDIRLVWSRTVSYVLLTAAVVAVYVGLVQATDSLFRTELGLGTSVLATLAVAVGFNPARARLQRWVDQLLYGERADPLRAASSVTTQLAVGADGPADVLPAVCRALRLPYAALHDEDRLVAEYGTRPAAVERIPLYYAGDDVGELVIGIRSGQSRLAPADRTVLELLAVPIGVALRAMALSEAVSRSRQQIVAAREEERRRLRRDLHDGLGPVLTGITFQADAVGNLVASDPDEAGRLAARIREATTGAIDDVRRLIYELRPVAVDELGLVEALRRHAEQLQQRSDGSPLTITVRMPEPMSELPAAVEVAAYRIVTEALTNVARHSRAASVDVRLTESVDAPAALLITVQDDGADRVTNGSCTAWQPGVGLSSMRERAAELGGTVDAGPTLTGGRVLARLPLGAPS